MLKRVVLAMLLVVGLVATTNAQDADKKTKKQMERAVKNTAGQMMKFYGPAKLTDEQKEKAMGVIKSHMKELVELRKAQDKLLTDEQKEARKEAMAKAKKDGLKGQKMFQAAFKAMGLSDEEKKEFDKAKKKINEHMNKMKEEINKSLSEDQLGMLKKKGGKKGKKGGKGKKAGKKSKDDKADGGSQEVSLKLPNMT